MRSRPVFHDSLRLFRLDDLRHRLIPLYRYDPTEELGLGDSEEEELAVRRLKEPLFLKITHALIAWQFNSHLFPTGTLEPGRKALALSCLWYKHKIKWKKLQRLFTWLLSE